MIFNATHKESFIDIDTSQFRNHGLWRFAGFDRNTVRYTRFVDSNTSLEFQFYPKTESELVVTFNVLRYETSHLTVHFMRVKLRSNDNIEYFINAVIRWVSDGGAKDFLTDLDDFANDPYYMMFMGFNSNPNGTGVSDLIRSGVKFKDRLTKVVKSRAESVR